MKLAILTVIFFISVTASTVVVEESTFVNIPNGYGGWRRVAPESLNEIDPTYDPQADVRFLLFTVNNPLVPQILTWNDMSTVANSHFSSARDTKLLCHGWQSTATLPSTFNPLITSSYLANGHDVNVIVVDWSVGAGSINYITSRNAVGPTGAHVGAFVDNLYAAGHLATHGDVSCIGQSLGSHVCGFVGKGVTLGRINTIFGVDPAGPLFSVFNPEARLAVTDADYVEVMHTDTVQLGIGDPIGHADFYPNGGTNMPGCLTAVCDHAVAAEYYAYTVNSDRMWGRTCASLDHMNADQCTGPGFAMGGQARNDIIALRGIFRMPTNAEWPFGIGQF